MGIINKTFGRNVVKRRKERGWTQEDLAEYSQVSLRQIQAIERGESGSTEETREKIAKCLGVHPLSLFEDPAYSRKPSDLEAFQRLADDYGFVVKVRRKSRSKKVNTTR